MARLVVLDVINVVTILTGEVVAQFKFTVLLMPNGPQKITGLPFDPTAFETENSVTNEELKKLITSSTRTKPNKKKKKPATDGKKVGYNRPYLNKRTNRDG